MRGLACVLMFQTHCYDSWLRNDQRGGEWFSVSQLLGTLPAPIFIFLAGLSVALVTEKFREKGMDRNAIARHTLLRGAEIFGLGCVFRLQEFVLGYKWVPWTDLLRVDVLNILGLCMMLMGGLCWLSSVSDVRVARTRGILAGLGVALAVGMLTPPLWTNWRPRFLPWWLESYINGVHVFQEPQHWLFPLFPWSAFAFVGLAVGFLLFTDLAKRSDVRFFSALTGAGAAAILLSMLFDRMPLQIYSTYDYWHASPEFLLLRCGVMVLVLAGSYAWCRWGVGEVGFSSAIQLGKTSLLVYWVHIEFVYGRFSILPKHRCGIALASLGLAVIFSAMLGLSVWRTRYKKREVRVLQQPAKGAAAEAAT
jgi:uncharacterized membrane protein